LFENAVLFRFFIQFLPTIAGTEMFKVQENVTNVTLEEL